MLKTDYKSVTQLQSLEKMFYRGLEASVSEFLGRAPYLWDIHFPCEEINRLKAFTLSSELDRSINHRPNLHSRESTFAGRFH